MSCSRVLILIGTTASIKMLPIGIHTMRSNVPANQVSTFAYSDSPFAHDFDFLRIPMTTFR